jgi:hypothetical protein
VRSRRVLLIEPDYKSSYPPIGLMKLAALLTIRSPQLCMPGSKWRPLTAHDWLRRFCWRRTEVEHCNQQRSHRGLQLWAPERARPVARLDSGLVIQQRDLPGGLIHEHKVAA